jgi:hypothetical protein
MRRIELPAYTMIGDMGRVALKLFRTTTLTLAACVLGGFAVVAGEEISIPKPNDPLAPPPPTPAVEESVVYLHVSVALNDLAFAADAAVPHEGAKEEVWQDGGMLAGHGPYQYFYRFVRGPLYVRTAGDRLVIEYPEFRYRLAIKLIQPDGSVIVGGCGYDNDPPKRLRLTANSRVSWSEAWTLKSETSFDPPSFLDPCRLTARDIDGTPIARSLLESRLGALASAIDAKLRERTASKERARTVWQNLQEPTELTPNLWLTLNPTSVQIGPIGLEREHLIQTAVHMLLSPTVRLGPQPAPDHRLLPPLELIPHAGERFHLALPIFAEYPTINRLLAQQLVGNEIPSPVGDPVKILSARLYGSGASLIVELGLSGGINGTVYAMGKPVLDTSTNILRFEEFNYTLETKNMLFKAANWMLRDNILAQLEPHTRIDLSEHVGILRRQLSRALTRQVTPDTWLEGSVTNLQPRAIYPVSGGVEIQVIANGSLQLFVR